MSATGIQLLVRSQAGTDPAGNVVERLFAVCCLITCLPVLIPAALCIAVLSRRTPFIAHQRVGKNGETFWMLKLRTMWNASTPRAHRGYVERISTRGVPPPKASSDPRVTSRFASFCRKYSIDELPQLLHVVTGQMALVGPRPLTRAELDVYYGGNIAEVLSIRPGISGLWQVSGRSALTYSQRRRLDLFLVRHRCPSLNGRILFLTALRVLAGRNSV